MFEPLPFEYDWKKPDHVAVWRWRADKLAKIRAEPKTIPALKAFYAENPAQFINDWGCTVDPRNIEVKLPAIMPFVLFPRQVEFLEWLTDCWRSQENGLGDKSRDVGMSWLAVGWAVAMGLHHDGFIAGFGSRKEEYVDSTTNPKALFWKVREFLINLPVEFRGGWMRENAAHMRITIPNTGSVLTGEAGDSIGRGDRTSVYFVDESSHLERPVLIDQSLSATTNCRIDMSSANGMGNPFAVKRWGGKIRVFTFHWRDDPRKDDAWYAKQQDRLDPLTLAQEVDIDYNAVEGSLIPSAWVQASVDALARLGLKPTGARSAALDVADEGDDMLALSGGHGVQIEFVEEWRGKGGDIFDSVQRSFMLCDENRFDSLRYDGDGLGAGVRGDAKQINARRAKDGVRQIPVDAFRGSEGVLDPTAKVEDTDRTNEDFFANRKAQAWWDVRRRFRNTYRWVVEGKPCNPDEIISIAPNCPNRQKLMTELSQPTYKLNEAGKIIVNKAPNGTKSPNMADSVMMLMASSSKCSLRITPGVIASMKRRRA